MEYTHGGDIYTYDGMLDFSANINPFGASDEVMQAAMRGVRRSEAYPDPWCRKLRRALAEQQQIPDETLIFGNGAADLIFSLVFALRPQKALLTAPSFSEYAQALRAGGCEPSYHYLREEEDFRLTERILPLLDESVDVFFLCSPDNPTGQVIDGALLERIVRRCGECRIRLVLDECFYEFMERPACAMSGGDVQGTPWVFLLRAFTKMHGMPGLRLGYGICADSELLERLQAVRQPWSVSAPAQEAGLVALSGQERIRETRAYVCRERKWMEGRLTEIGVKHYPSSANYLLLHSEHDLFTRLLERKILIRDCGDYEGLKRGYYRTAIRRHEENVRLLTALEDIYKER